MTTHITHEMPLPQPWYQSEKILCIALCAFLFAIPVSSSLKSISEVVVLFLIVTTQLNKRSLHFLSQQMWVRATAIFLCIVIVACFWSPAGWGDLSFVLEKYSKLIWLPVLTLGFANRKTRMWSLHAFMAAMVLICAIALCRSFGWLYSKDPSGTVFRNYIMNGHMVAFASYLAAYFAVKKPAFRVGYIGLFLLYTYEVLFVSIGRTGYIVYFMLMALLLLQLLKKKQLIVGMLVLLFAGTLLLHFSPTMQQGVKNVQTDVLNFNHGHEDTSLGFRFQFYRFAFELFKRSPIVGNGTASVAYYFNTDHPVPNWKKHLHEPHNQYWMIAAEYGCLGLFSYLFLLFSFIYAALRLKEMKYFAFALLLPFIVGCFTDSLLFYSGSGYFFLTMLALCLGESFQDYKSKQQC